MVEVGINSNNDFEGDFMKKLIKQFKIIIPNEYKDGFYSEIAFENARRFIVFGSAFLVFELLIHNTLKDSMDSLYLNTLMAMIVFQTFVIILFIRGYYYKKNCDKPYFRIFFYITICLILFWCLFITLLIQKSSDRITPFIMGIYIISAVAYINPRISFPIYISIYIGFIVFLPSYQADQNVLIPHYLNSSFIVLVAAILSRMLFNFRLNVYIDKQIIEQQHNQLKDLSIRDSMTGLYNHRCSYERIEEEIIKSNRYGMPLSLVLIDIDKFKTVNDKFGHPFGDTVIKSIAKLITKNIRATDFAGRYGGEEFILILYNSDLANAYITAERLRQEIENYDFGNNHQITISGGVVQYYNETAVDLVGKADKLLYRAKQNGRNRIEKLHKVKV